MRDVLHNIISCKIRLFIIYLILLVDLGVDARAQDFPDFALNIVPPSPAAASLGEYGNVPVSLYTGTPSINVPIYTLDAEILNIDVSLSYNAGGIQVSQDAGPAGLGWSLNAGGVITRVMRGNPDDFPTGYLYTQQDIDNVWDQLAQPMYQECNGSNDCPCPSDPGDPYYSVCDYRVGVASTTGNQYNTQYDPAPDVFMYNFNGASGKFFVKDHVGHDAKGGDIKISYTMNNNGYSYISGWVITDPGGNIYHFGDFASIGSNEFVEITNVLGNGGATGAPNYTYVSSWYLRKITSSSGELLAEFEYDGGSVNGYKSTASDAGMHELNKHGWRRWSWDSSNNTQESQDNSTLQTIIYHEELYVKKIKTNKYIIEFHNDGRDDHKPGDNTRRFSRILIMSRGTGSGGSDVRTKELVFNYFYANDEDIVPSGVMGENSSHVREYIMERLMLESIDVVDDSDNDLLSYEFEYYGYGDDANYFKLPPKTSFSEDHWGYYNGVGSNNNTGDDRGMIPFFSWVSEDGNNSIAYPEKNAHGASDRRADGTGAYMQAGTLRKITYPTGGWTLFEYEPHDYSVVGNNGEEAPYFYQYDPPIGEATSGGSQGFDESRILVDETIEPHDPNVYIEFTPVTWTNVKITYSTFTEPRPASIYQYVRLYEVVAGGSLSLVWEESSLYPGSTHHTGDWEDAGFDYIPVMGGKTYRLSVDPGCNLDANDPHCGAEMFVQWSEHEQKIFTAGGLRIDKITSHNGSGDQVTREYTYTLDKLSFLCDQDQPDFSSGALVRKPRYLEKVIEYVGLNASNIETYLRAHTSSLDDSGLGSHIGYQQVTEYVSDGSSTTTFFLNSRGQKNDCIVEAAHDVIEPRVRETVSGWSVTFVEEDSDLLGRSYPTSFDWKRGVPLMVVQQDDLGDVLIIQENTYDFPDNESYLFTNLPRLVWAGGLNYTDAHLPGTQADYMLNYARFATMSGSVLLTKKEVTRYE